jgi:MoxR-like ATPase
VIQGKRPTIELVLCCLVAEGHVLIEDVPGVGKTLLAKSLARSIAGDFSRIQFTPDLLPADVTGVSIWDRVGSSFAFQPGPVFANVVLGDEINRSSPRTQAALLEAMEEGQVTSDGVTRKLPAPFMVVATQNPLEHEGTYPLPESQLDRFMMRVDVGYPSRDKELEMLNTHGDHSAYDDLDAVSNVEEMESMIDLARQVTLGEPVRNYLLDLVLATRQHPDLLAGASPRAALHLQRAARAWAAARARDYVTPDDLKAVFSPIVAHRMIHRPEAVIRGNSGAETALAVLDRVPVPTPA